MPVGHCCLLSPYGRRFRKRVCARGLEPKGWLPRLGPSQQWPPVPSHAPIQAGQAGSKGPLAAQPGSCHGAWGPARHNPLTAVQPCPAQLATRGAAQPSQGGLPACASVGDGKLRRAGGGALLGFLQHPRSWPPAGAQRTVCTKLQVPCQANGAGSVTVVNSVIITIILSNPG